MNNEFLDTLAKKPIINTFKLAYKMLLSNKLLFVVLTMIFIALHAMPRFFYANLPIVSIMITLIVITLTNIIFQVLTQSNYLYVCKTILESKNEEECIKTIKSTEVTTIFSEYFSRALGSSIAVIIILIPLLFVLREILHIREYKDVILTALLLLILYIYPIVAQKITISKNFKEAFVATFSIFSTKVWKQSLNLSYAKFVISMAIILAGIYYSVIFIFTNVFDDSSSIVSLSITVLTMIFSMFFSLYIIPTFMMIAQHISKSKKSI